MANFSIVTASRAEHVASNVLLKAVFKMWGDDA